ncbi:phospholipase A1 VesT1.02 isoform X1 [Musca domestica]|uniref:Phospholipase A1 VesT1.02 isoform X1 n=1 Tax=Musca domestica TaxID=7370 RepID=A0A9J7CQP2_MUSDO|nr:phospholipase A1 VesT1.02 isoform X1 [Musca domestica]
MSIPVFILLMVLLIYSPGGSTLKAKADGNSSEDGINLKISDAVHAVCPFFGNAAKSHPQNPPILEQVYFQFQSACRSREYPIPETKKLLEIPEYDGNKTTVVFIPGWMALPTDRFVSALAKAYHCRGGYNFVVLNTNGFLSTGYYTSAFNTDKLGEFVAMGLRNMQIAPERIHLIDHSLGAHIAGLAGSHYQNLTGHKLERITGLDPARPCFVAPIIFPRFAADVAKFVDVIHSNPNDSGIKEPLGGVDFYPAGVDTIKPGCMGQPDNCSHLRSIYYYIETLYPGNEINFKGIQCHHFENLVAKNCSGSKTNVAMGIAASAENKGIFYVSVNGRPPYGTNAKPANDNTMSDKCGECSK